MLRGFRWQFIALTLSFVLFVFSLVIRSNNPQLPLPVVTASPTATLQSTQLPENTPAPTATHISTQVTATTPAKIVYREGLVGQVQHLNPLLADLNPVDRDITALMFEGLTRINEYGEPVPALANEWLISNDGLAYVFFLREDILWHDGIQFTADDVIFTMAILSDRSFPGSQELSKFWHTVEVQKLGDFVVRFRLTQPLASFLSKLTIGILPQHALAGFSAEQIAHHPFNLSPIGTGPYQLEALRSTNRSIVDLVELQLAPVYRQREEGKTGYAIEQLSFQLYATFDEAVQGLQTNEIDGLAARNRDERSFLLNTREIRIYTGLESIVGMLIFNWNEGENRFFQDKRVRLGLQIGIDPGSIIETHLSNQAILADSPLLPGSWAYASDIPPIHHDPTQAIAYFDTANIQTASEIITVEEGEPTPVLTPTSPDAPRYQFSILSPDDPPLVAIAESIASQWSQYNLAVNVEVTPSEQYRLRIEAGEFDAALVELPIGTDPDVYMFWDQGQYPEGKNFGGVSDPSISEWLERARQETNGHNQVTLYANFQRDFIEQAIALPLYYPLFTYAIHSNINGVQIGFLGSPADRFRTIANWSFRSDT